jgi:hypothetical protein
MGALHRYLMKNLGVAASIALLSTGASAGGCGYHGCGAGYYGHSHAAPVYLFASAAAAPPRYVVDQGPDYTGPNVTVFFPRAYDAGYVDTSAYPYVGHHAYRYRAKPATRVMHVRMSTHRHARTPAQFGWPQRTAPAR